MATKQVVIRDLTAAIGEMRSLAKDKSLSPTAAAMLRLMLKMAEALRKQALDV